MKAKLFLEIQKKYKDRFIPWMVHFELTHRCNLRCQHCYVVPEKSASELRYDEIVGIIEQLYKVGVMVLVFSGGEVLLREDILEILKFAAPNFFIIILSNGTLITSQVATRLRELKITQVEVSLYAGKVDIHDKITGVAGSFARTMEGLKALQKGQIPMVLKYVAMKDNLGEYDRLAELAKELNARLEIGPLMTPKTDGSRVPLQYSIEQKNWNNYFPPELSGRMGGIDKRREKSGGVSPSDKELCTAGKSVCSISPQGIVYPCVILPWNLGNLREKGFEEIWFKNPIKDLKLLRSLVLSDIRECRDCDISANCIPCVGRNYLERGNISECSPDYCRLAHYFSGSSIT